MKKNGFTLIELVLIIVIIGILAAIAIPSYVNMVREAKEASTQGSLGAIRAAITMSYAQSATQGSPRFPTLAELNDGSLFQSGTVPVNALIQGTLPVDDQTFVAIANEPTQCSDLTGTVYCGGMPVFNPPWPPGCGGNAWLYLESEGKVWAATDDCALSNTLDW